MKSSCGIPRRNNIERSKILTEECKKCDGSCGTCFEGNDRRRKRKIYYTANKEKLLEKSRTYVKEHSTSISEKRKEKRIQRGPILFEKECETCKETFFTKNAAKKNCDQHSYKQSAKERSYRREYMLKRTYGITLDQYEELLQKQDNRCYVCEKHKDTFNKNLSVDHNHETGEIRGLLCTHCNHRIIGRHKDPAVFYRAAKYLENKTGWFVPDEFKKGPKKKKRKKTRY